VSSKVETKSKEWLKSSTLDGLQELTFHGGRPPRSLPLSALCFAPTMRIAAFFFCHLPKIDAGPMLVFPQLKHLRLQEVVISEAVIHHLIIGCTALVGLEINVVHELTSAHIVSSIIHTLVFWLVVHY
jgi:hypothetical protein